MSKRSPVTIKFKEKVGVKQMKESSINRNWMVTNFLNQGDSSQGPPICM